MYYGASCCPNPCATPYAPYGGYPYGGTSTFAIVLVLFILLVIVIGSRAFR